MTERLSFSWNIAATNPQHRVYKTGNQSKLLQAIETLESFVTATELSKSLTDTEQISNK